MCRLKIRILRHPKIFFLFYYLLLLSFPKTILAKAERIEKIEVHNNEHAKKAAIVSASGLKINQEITESLLKEARDRLGSNIIFEKVTVTEAPGSDPMHSVIIIWVKEKISWFIVPSFSFSEGDYSGGATYLESNLFGRFKKLLLFADYGNQASHAILGYRDPSLFDSRFILSVDGVFRLDHMRVYEDRVQVRQVNVVERGVTIMPGYQWSDHFSSSVGGSYRWITEHLISTSPGLRTINLTEGNNDAFLLDFHYNDTEIFDGLSEGSDIELQSELSDGRFFSDFNYFKQVFRLTNGIGILHHTINFNSGVSIQLARDLPFYYELTLGGEDNLRGYLYREFRGDTKYEFGEEVTVPIFDFKRFILRGIGFWDSGLIYFKNTQFVRSDWHNGLGTGLRIYVKGIAVPIVGYDIGYGIEDNSYATYLTIGASF
ncbi:MAG: family outer membrane protein [Bacteriovoracaceae bacterium]|nr:family outer membrane protein [Bacteriovoracaceae bacterium]